MSRRIGIDLGGTKIEIVVLDEGGGELVRRRVDTPAGDYRGTIEAIAGLVENAEAETGPAASIGVGMPGTISPATGLVKNANSSCLIGERFDEDLRSRLGRDVVCANDANCFALSEAVDGAGAGASTVFGVILGTGVGGGLIVDERILVGANAIGGEWGHNPLPWPVGDERPGPACYCGQTGCVEMFLSGPAVEREYAQLTGRRLRATDIAGAVDNDEAALEVIERYEERLARGLSSIINVIDPDVIVLGGGLSRITRLYEQVPARWDTYVFSDHVATRLLPPVHGDSGGVRGAAWLGARTG